jgi:predicted exporter
LNMKSAALVWVVVVACLSAALVFQLHRGVKLQTDMTALIPAEDRDIAISRAKDRVAEILTERVFLLVGDHDRSLARAAGAQLAKTLTDSGLTRSVTYHVSSDALKSLGKMYFPYRFGLLADVDRERLQKDQGAQIVSRALASVYGPSSIVDAKLLRYDPFLLMPEFLNHLPMPSLGLTPDEGVLSTREASLTWVLLVVQLRGDVYSGVFQKRFISVLDAAIRQAFAQTPNLKVLRAGAVFYAYAGSESATREASHLGAVSLIGSIALILIVFRALRPLWLTLLAIGIGILCAFTACFLIFGGIHVVVLLFGIGLNGIAIDYCLQYISARFGPVAGAPDDRLRQVRPGITIGAATTLIGYVTLMLAPFPGLLQLALFSAVGLVGSFITIVLWLPFLDSREPLGRSTRILAMANSLWLFCEGAQWRTLRWSVIAAIGLATIVGASKMRTDDDIRHQQALAANLSAQESHLRRLTGVSGGTQFILVRAPNRDAALQTEEALRQRLADAQRLGALRGFESLAQFVPSVARQRDNRELVTNKLMRPYLAAYYQRLGMSGDVPAGDDGFLTLDAIGNDSPIAFLRNLVLGFGARETIDLVLLMGVSQPKMIERSISQMPGVTFVDPTADITRLLASYRRRAMILIAVSALLMLPVLVFRYGLIDGLRVMLPPAIAVLVAPPLVALIGVPFTFFSAVALVLVLSIGFDYAVFCREATPARRPVTMLGIWLAMVTTLSSFGLLALSSTSAVRTFGATLVVGTILAFAFSPFASSPTRNS